MTAVLCWDIDGTLLSTARAGIFAWQDAIQEVLGREAALGDYPTAGLTDVQIGRLLVEKVVGTADNDIARRLLQRYEALLPSRLHYRTGEVLPNVRAILERLRQRDGVLSLLLTGNTAAGGRAKLAHYGLDEFFEHGAFADGTDDRPAIARRAVEIAEDLLGPIDRGRLFVIGDTPHDIDCGRAVGARTVAVATGGYSEAQLRAHRPWWLLGRLPDPAAFCAHVDVG